MSSFDFAIEHTFTAEGGARFTDHPADAGGATRWGVTEGVARKHGYTGDMRMLPRELALQIAKQEFWRPLRLEEIESDLVAAEIFDTAFLSGPRTAAKIAQRATNLMYADSDLPLVKIDGVIGPQTLGAINGLLPRYERHLLAALNGYQFVHFTEVAKKRPQNARPFLRGWMLRLGAFMEAA